jgi:hypothetical protein
MRGINIPFGGDNGLNLADQEQVLEIFNQNTWSKIYGGLLSQGCIKLGATPESMADQILSSYNLQVPTWDEIINAAELGNVMLAHFGVIKHMFLAASLQHPYLEVANEYQDKIKTAKPKFFGGSLWHFAQEVQPKGYWKCCFQIGLMVFTHEIPCEVHVKPADKINSAEEGFFNSVDDILSLRQEFMREIEHIYNVCNTIEKMGLIKIDQDAVNGLQEWTWLHLKKITDQSHNPLSRNIDKELEAIKTPLTRFFLTYNTVLAFNLIGASDIDEWEKIVLTAADLIKVNGLFPGDGDA